MPDLAPVYARLESLLSKHATGLKVSYDFADANAASTTKKDPAPRPPAQGPEMVLLGAPSDSYPKGECFAAVKLGKRYVSYYLMGMYRDPSLTEGMSEMLLKHKKGQSCFNFTRVDDELFHELDLLTARCHDHYDKDGLLR
jgi:hypothetical protein